jgi:glucose-1-phosphate adenylyltransferase
MGMKDVLTMILAGGKGSRLYPLTKDRAKPAVPFGGIYRIIDFVLNNCINSNLRKINVLTQYKFMSLDRHLKEGWGFLSRQLGEYIDIIPPQQRVGEQWYQGTVNAIFQNIYTIEKESPNYVLILSGDHVYKMDYSRMILFHKEKKADLTLAVTQVEKEQASRFGVVEMNPQGQVVWFEEKPSLEKIEAWEDKRVREWKREEPDPRFLTFSPSYSPAAGYCWVSMGIYLFNTEVLLKKLREESVENCTQDIGEKFVPAMLEQNAVYGYPFGIYNPEFPSSNPPSSDAGYWRDIGTLDAYWEAHMDLVSVTPLFNLYDRNWPIRTYQEQFPPPKFVHAEEYPGGRMGVALNSMVSQGCIISGGRVQNSVLSPNVRVNSYAQIYESVLLEGVQIGRRARIRKAILDKGVIVPEGFEIGFNLERDRQQFVVSPGGVVVVSKDSF